MTDDRTLGQLVADATHDVSELLRAEVALAKAELRADLRNGGMAGGLFGAAGYLVLLASITLCIAAGYGLVAAGLAAWAAFLVLGGALVVLAAILVLIGRWLAGKVGPPERAIRSTKQALATVRPNGRDR